MPAPVQSLETRVTGALAAAVTLLTPRVPSTRVYVRASGGYAEQRDGVPAVLVITTPGLGLQTKRLLTPARLEVTVFTTAILIDSQNGAVSAQKLDDEDPDWRTAWRARLTESVGGHPLVSVAECLRVFVDPTATLDMSQFEASNLWWSAVNFRTLCRVTEVP